MKGQEIKKNRTENHYAGLFFTYFLFIVLPFCFSAGLQDAEQSIKLVALSFGITVVSLWLLISAIRKRTIFQNTLPRLNMFYCMVFFLLCQVLAFPKSINTTDGLFELLKVILFFLVFFISFLLIRSGDKWKESVIKGVNISVLLFTGFAIIQLIPMVKGLMEQGKPIRIDYSFSSGLGNKNFYAETLLLSLPFVVMGISRFEKFWKVVSIINTIIIGLSIVMLQTMSTWLAVFIVVLFIIAVFLLYGRNFPDIKTGFVKKSVIGLGCVLLAVFVIYQTTSQTQNVEILKKRISQVSNYITDPETLNKGGDINDNSFYERIILWRNSIRMIGDNFLTGVGMANWKIYFPSYGSAEAQFMNTGNTRFQRPHNDFLFIAAETGIPGLIAFLSILFFAFMYGFRIMRKAASQKSYIEVVLLLSGLIFYCTVAMVSLPGDRFFPMILFFMTITFITSQYCDSTPEAIKKLKPGLFVFILIMGLIAGFSGITLGMKRFGSEVFLARAIKAQKNKSWPAMTRQLNMIDTKTFPLDYTSTPVDWYKGFALFYNGNAKEAKHFFTEAEKINPNHVQILNDLGTCFNLEGDVETAKSYYKKTLVLAPYHPDALVNLSIVYYNTNKLDSAFYTISHYNTKPSQQYKNVLSVILQAKTQNFLSSQRTGPTDNLLIKIKDQEFLLKAFEKSKADRISFEEALLQIN